MKILFAIYLVGVVLTALWMIRSIDLDKDSEFPLRFYIFGGLIISIIWPIALIEAIYQWMSHNENNT